MHSALAQYITYTCTQGIKELMTDVSIGCFWLHFSTFKSADVEGALKEAAYHLLHSLKNTRDSPKESMCVSSVV